MGSPKWRCYAAALIATPAVAGVEEAVNDYILPHLAAFTEAAEVLDDAAQESCEAKGLVGPYNAAFDAWMAVADVRLGPSEQGALSLSFWPDKRGFTERTLADLISNKDPVAEDQAAFEEISIAARGFFALERMFYDSQFNDYAEGDYACTLVRALTRDVVDQVTALQAQWTDFAPLLLDPGSAGNTTYLDKAEAQIPPAMAEQDFSTAMAAMAELRGPIDAFFEAVQVNADNPTVRRNRLNLLSRIRTICSAVADLTKLDG